MTLKIENLTYYYTQNADDYLFKDVTETFDEGVMYAILGSSGSGKTTLLSLLAGLDTPKSGTVKFDETDIKKQGLTKYRLNTVSTVFQSFNLLTYMTAFQNVKTAINISGVKYADEKQAIIDIFAKVGLGEELIYKPVKQLSGGQQQRVAIARSLITKSKIIIADEPTGNLDEQTTQDIVKIFQDIAHNENKIVIVVTHENEVAKASDVIYELKDKVFARKLA
ncbi:ABC transporter ATP-binding protein [Lactococcus hodotermopsidis]|uniref:ABC transporter ATP-binding protein n=1 Tax=Pseudolactococcus hodotermopsidis TaxID=2709157 RepID=A0A6A0B8H6_9LACT|nr:ABC transporter ATP-binding protein [Lactococcus hodotermopsidis]GFH41699.1 ABC transporter ATP-binding protein [Lactococcus hodotermopsidis]